MNYPRIRKLFSALLPGMAALIACGANVSYAEDIVLFDAATTPLSAIESKNGATFAIKDGILEVATHGKPGYPGVIIKGDWDLSGCNRITFELVNDGGVRRTFGVTVRLENPDAVPAEGKGLLLSQLRIHSNPKLADYSIALPPLLPHVREIRSSLTGMRGTPYDTLGAVADLDPGKTVSVAVYVSERLELDWRWGVKRIVAHTGESVVPEWMHMTADSFFPFIDKYGQFKHKEWPGKVHSDKDLKVAIEREAADLKAHPGPKSWNQYGGWADGPQLEATGNFRVEKVDGKWWFVDPEGRLWWSHGPLRVSASGAVTPLAGRDKWFEDLPAKNSPMAEFYKNGDEMLQTSYDKRNIKHVYDFSAANAYRKYGEGWAERFADVTHDRLRSWGLNTIANGSDRNIRRMNRTPYAVRLELWSKPLVAAPEGFFPFRDPFDPSFREGVRDQTEKFKADIENPWCFGVFFDNEVHWGGPTSLAEWTLASPADQAAKIEFRDRMKTKYGTIGKLNSVWGTNYPDWEVFLISTKTRLGDGAQNDLAEFTLAIADAYFRGIWEEFKAVAPDKLAMGCRFSGSKRPEFAVRLSAKYTDIVSFNVYARHLEDFNRLPEDIDKPVIIGEFHIGARDRGLFHPSLIEVENQDERAKTYVHYVTSALQHPKIVGVHWHHYGDQATTGRFDGENFQVGFLDVCDTPYAETIDGLRDVGYRMYDIRSSR